MAVFSLNTNTQELASNTVTQPSAGAQFSITVPAGEVWMLNSVAATLTTSATAGSRLVGWNIKDAAGNIVYQFKLPTQTFGTNKTVLFGVAIGGLSQSVTDQVSMSALPNMPMGTGWSFNTAPSAFQADDQWSSIGYSYTKIGNAQV